MTIESRRSNNRLSNMHDNFYRENKNSHEYKHNITHSHSLKRIHTFLHTRLLLERRDTPKKVGVRHQSDYPGKSRQTKRE